MKPLFCQRPDRDAPRMKCGYPLPCPHHTATMDTHGRVALPPEWPSTPAIVRLHDIADTLRKDYPSV